MFITEQVEKRIKTWLWDIAYTAAVAGLNEAQESLTGLGLPAWAVLVIGLAISQVSKFVRNKYCSAV